MPFSLGVVDLLVLAVLAAFAVIGYKKGLVTMVTTLVSTIGAYLAAFLLARPIAAALAGAGGVFAKTRASIELFFLRQAGGINQSVGQSVAALRLPGFLQKPLLGKLDLSAPLTASAEQLATRAFRLLLTGIAALLIFIAVWLLFRLLAGVLNACFSRIGALHIANRTLGLVAGLLNGALILLVIMAILGLFAPVAPRLAAALKDGPVARYFYDFNLFLSLLAMLSAGGS